MTQAGGLEEKLSDFSLELLVLGIVLEKVKVTFHVIVMSAQNTSIKIYSMKTLSFLLCFCNTFFLLLLIKCALLVLLPLNMVCGR